MLYEYYQSIVDSIDDENIKDALVPLIPRGVQDDVIVSRLNRAFEELMVSISTNDRHAQFIDLRLRTVSRAFIEGTLSYKDAHYTMQALGFARKLSESFIDSGASQDIGRKKRTIKKFVDVQVYLRDFSYPQDDSRLTDRMFLDLNIELRDTFSQGLAEIYSLTDFYLPKGVTMQTGSSYHEKFAYFLQYPRKLISHLASEVIHLCYAKYPFSEGHRPLPLSGDDLYQERLAFVPKNPEFLRVILTQGIMRMIEAQCLAAGFTAFLEKHGVTLFGNTYKFDLTDQTLSRHLGYVASVGAGFTIDLKSASDSNTHQLMKTRLPHLYDLFLPFASKQTYVSKEDYNIGKEDFDKLLYNEVTGKISTAMYTGMGSIFCFPLETLIFHVIALSALTQLALDRDVYDIVEGFLQEGLRVYGDDIVFAIPLHVYRRDPEYWAYFTELAYKAVCSELELYGFRVNIHKSFRNSSALKEVCGAYIYKGRDIRPVNLKYVPGKSDLRFESDVAFVNGNIAIGLDTSAKVIMDQMEKGYPDVFYRIPFNFFDVRSNHFLFSPKKVPYKAFKDREDVRCYTEMLDIFKKLYLLTETGGQADICSYIRFLLKEGHAKHIGVADPFRKISLTSSRIKRHTRKGKKANIVFKTYPKIAAIEIEVTEVSVEFNSNLYLYAFPSVRKTTEISRVVKRFSFKPTDVCNLIGSPVKQPGSFKQLADVTHRVTLNSSTTSLWGLNIDEPDLAKLLTEDFNVIKTKLKSWRNMLRYRNI